MQLFQQLGREIFLRGTCIQCHAIRGTDAGAIMGPDLTHLGTRGTIAAGTLPNTPTALALWVSDSQRFKPGNQMPPHVVRADDVGPLVAYLESLR